MKELDVPIVIKTDSVRNVRNKPTQRIESGIQSEILLPSSTCTVSSSLSCERFVGIIVNKKYYFSKADLIICKNIHKVKGIQENLKTEDKGFEGVATNVRTPCSSLVISDTNLQRSKNSIQQGRENFTVDNQLSPRFLYLGLCLLVGQHWLTFEVTETFVKIFHQSESNITKI